jgi:hypothetical protein
MKKLIRLALKTRNFWLNIGAACAFAQFGDASLKFSNGLFEI